MPRPALDKDSFVANTPSFTQMNQLFEQARRHREAVRAMRPNSQLASDA